MRAMGSNESIFASMTGDAGAIVFPAVVVVCGFLGAVLIARFFAANSKQRKWMAIPGFILGATVGYALFWAAVLLTHWWPFSDGP